MDKLELKKELISLKEDIIQMTNDSEKANELLNKLLKVNTDINTTPIELNVGERIDSLDSETFSIVKTSQGVLYNERGYYSVFVSPSHELYNLLVSIIASKDKILEGNEEDLNTYFSIIAYCLQLPKYIPYDFEMSVEAAKLMIYALEKMQKQYIDDAELQEETPIENTDFTEMIKALGEISKSIKEEEKGK